jgi:8-oxo-dGTP diphosphatase
MSQPSQKHVRVGVGVLVRDPSRRSNIFCGIRLGSHGAGSLALPGGHLEMMESWEDCAKREVWEEMNVKIMNVKFAHVTNSIMHEESKHYITIYMTAEMADMNQCPINREPEKCQGWESISWEDLLRIRQSGTPTLFGPLRQLLDDNPTTVYEFLKANEHAAGFLETSLG